MIENRKMKQGHLPSLDGLRGVAAIAVVISHYKLFGYQSLLAGNEAVAIFFCLSAFLMAILYLPETFTPERLRHYAVSRVARVYPIYVVAILVATICTELFDDYPHPISGTVAFIRHLLLIGSSGVFWSIPPEVQFYALFALIWYSYSNFGVYTTALIAAAGLAFTALLGFPGPGIFLFSKLHFFIFGAASGFIFLRIKSLQTPVFIPVAALGILVGIFALDASHGAKWPTSLAFIAALNILLLAKEHPISSYILASSPLRHLGRISFSVYLFHVPIMFIVFRSLRAFGLPDSVVCGAALCAVLLVASVIHFVIERPLQRALTVGLSRLGENNQPPAKASVTDRS